MITTTRQNTDNMNINRTKITKKQKLYGRFKRVISGISQEKTEMPKKRKP